MDQSTQQKQRFLREEILQSNYDPEEFINFLKQDLKIKELDVDKLQMRTLTQIVAKFKQYKYYQSNESNQNIVKSAPKKKKIQYEKNGTTFDYQFEQTIKCVQTDAFSHKLEVYIPNIQVKQTEGIFFSLGSKTEIYFNIHTNLNKPATKRQQEDFQWLSDTLAKLYPLQAMPELIAVSKQNEGNNEKRRKELEQFIQILAEREEMRRSNLFYQFLTVPVDKFQKMKKNYDSMSFVKNIHSVKNEQGKIEVNFTNKLRNYVLSTAEYIRKVPKIHEQISQSVERVVSNLQMTSKEIYKIVDYFAQLHESYNEVTNKSPQFKIPEYSQILINTNNLFHTLANDLVTKTHVLNSNIKEFSKIQLNYDRSINKLYRNLSEAEKDYVYFKTSLNRKKERIYPEVAKWEVEERAIENRRLSKEDAFQLMLPKETAQQNEQKQWVAYLYQNYRLEFENYLRFETKRYVDVYCTFCAQLLLNNKNYIEEITKFLEQSKKLVKS